jgi:hypothetical protein
VEDCFLETIIQAVGDILSHGCFLYRISYAKNLGFYTMLHAEFHEENETRCEPKSYQTAIRCGAGGSEFKRKP